MKRVRALGTLMADGPQPDFSKEQRESNGENNWLITFSKTKRISSD
jgi:hypothetical protein